jgi:antitoxin CptB
MPALHRIDADSAVARGYIKPRPAMSGLSAFHCGTFPMTGTTRSSEGLDDRRKRLLFRCWHRGTREMDLILGRFADAEIGALSKDELTELEQLLEIPDPDFYAAVTGAQPLPQDMPAALFARIQAFRAVDRD